MRVGLFVPRSLAVVHITIVEGDEASVVSTNRGSISSQTHSEWLRVELKKGNDVFMVRYHYVLSGYPAEAKLLQLIASDTQENNP